MKFKDYKKCIIVDEKNRPMSWSPRDEQLCYCNDEYYLDWIFPIKIVSIKTARKQIRNTIENRKLWHMDDDTQYKLMPVKEK
jgi:hypothetical protein